MFQTNVLDDYMDYLSSMKGRSEATIREYYYDIRLFLRFLKIRKMSLENVEFDEIDIDDIDADFLNTVTKQDIYAYTSYLDKYRKNSSKTKYRKLSSIRSFFDYLYQKIEVIDDNPTENIDMPKIEKSLPIYLTLEESIHLLKSVREYKQKSIYQKRDYAIILIFLNCGLRLSELASLQLQDVQSSDTLRVRGKGNKERFVYLNEACRLAIDEYLKERNQLESDTPYLFLSMRKNQMSNRSIQHMIEKHLKLAGFDTDKYTVHKLRHTAATLMYKYGDEDIKALQEILGHESIATTQIYTHIDKDDIKQVMKNHPLGKNEELEKMIEDDQVGEE